MKLGTLPLLSTVPLAVVAPAAVAQTPDIVIHEVGDTWRDFGELAGKRAYAFGAGICNQGDTPVAVAPYFDMPVVGHNVFRIAQGRITQLGYGFMSLRVCALSQLGCGDCQPTACASLGVGCADTSLLFDGSIGWAKWAIDANRGEWPAIPPGPTGDPDLLAGRIQIDSAALGDPGSVYVAEAQVVSGHDQQLGQGRNNVSWREVSLLSPAQPSSVGTTHVGQPAIAAWQVTHPDVRVQELTVVDEGGPGIDGTFWLASRAIDLGNGRWRYEYAVQNVSSEVAARGLVVETPCGAGEVDADLFFGIEHHGGSPYADTPWAFARTRGALRWTTDTFLADPNANALRWGTLYAFSVESDAAPRDGTARLVLFERAEQLTATVRVPAASPCRGAGTLPPAQQTVPSRRP